MDAELQKLDAFFNPKSVAVIGATKKVDKAGYVIFKNLATNKDRSVFKGELYPVNPGEDSILGYKCHKSLSKIPGEVELIVVIVPAKIVPSVMEEAVAKKVKTAIIISSGFKEVGNKDLEAQVIAAAAKGGIRVLGPNCLGVYYSKTGIDTLFLPETKVLTTGEDVVATPRPLPGNIAMVTQSGAFGVAALDYLTGRQMGVSKFVSFGNKSDVSESDILHYLLYDNETKVILVYLEDVKSGREFLKIAKKVTVKKPVVVIKSGRSAAGARAAASHTGAIAGSDKIYDAAFEQGGVIRARDMEEFFDIGKALAMQPPAMGKNIGILTDAGGPGVMTVDELESLGLTVERFCEETDRKFEELKAKDVILKIAATHNPVDLTGSVTDDMFVTAADIMFQDPQIYGIILLGLHHMPGLREKYIDGIVEISKKYNKPIVMCDIGATEMALYTRSRFDRLCVPSFESPEDAARAMAALVSYGEYLKRNGCADEYIAKFKKNCKP
ncbi:MAG: acetate--CoA ligase family protein [Candidatus Bathyarchaeota archaeon]|nr:acetate--CoA ligase family protein [Candidatus Bathyarchaeota archaeon]